MLHRKQIRTKNFIGRLSLRGIMNKYWSILSVLNTHEKKFMTIDRFVSEDSKNTVSR